MDVTDLPFNRLLGLRSSESGDEIVLTPEPQHLNHVATLHASVLYGLAEAASGQILLRRFPQLADGFMAVLRNASVKYRQPGRSTEDSVARGVIEEVKADAFQSQLDSRGRAMLDIEVKVRQNETPLLTGTFTWFVSKIEHAVE